MGAEEDVADVAGIATEDVVMIFAVGKEDLCLVGKLEPTVLKVGFQ